jgi:hypothetical protein
MSAPAETEERAALIARAPRLAKLLRTSDLIWCRRAVAAEEARAASEAAWEAEVEAQRANMGQAIQAAAPLGAAGVCA